MMMPGDLAGDLVSENGGYRWIQWIPKPNRSSKFNKEHED
jgi:hypothetical protein